MIDNGGNARETMETVRRYFTIGYNFEFKLINNNEALRVNTLHRKSDFTFVNRFLNVPNG